MVEGRVVEGGGKVWRLIRKWIFFDEKLSKEQYNPKDPKNSPDELKKIY